MEFEVKHTLTEGNILDILTTAIEGGIGYWCCLDNSHPDWVEAREQWKAEHKDEIPCYCDVAYQVMKNGKAVILEDEEDDTIYELTLEKFQQGCALYTQRTGKDIHKAMDESDFDANDADAIIQFAVNGEIIYG